MIKSFIFFCILFTCSVVNAAVVARPVIVVRSTPVRVVVQKSEQEVTEFAKHFDWVPVKDDV